MMGTLNCSFAALVQKLDIKESRLTVFFVVVSRRWGQTRTETMCACSLLVSSAQLAVKLHANFLSLL